MKNPCTLFIDALKTKIQQEEICCFYSSKCYVSLLCLTEPSRDSQMKSTENIIAQTNVFRSHSITQSVTGRTALCSSITHWDMIGLMQMNKNVNRVNPNLQKSVLSGTVLQEQYLHVYPHPFIILSPLVYFLSHSEWLSPTHAQFCP